MTMGSNDIKSENDNEEEKNFKNHTRHSNDSKSEIVKLNLEWKRQTKKIRRN